MARGNVASGDLLCCRNEARNRAAVTAAAASRRWRIIGFGGLYDDPFDPGWGAEVAYHFAREGWGRGCATELTRYCVALAHGALRLGEVRAFAHPGNIASRRVLAKAGFVEQFVPEMNRYLYAHQVA